MPEACCVPGCSNRRAAGYTLFRVPAKKFVKKEDLPWAVDLEKIILGLREDHHIKELYKRDAVRICVEHFNHSDILYAKSRKQLRKGALPTLNLPKKSGQLLPNPYTKQLKKVKRERPVSRLAPPPVIRHKTFSSLMRSAGKLRRKDWNVSIGENIIEIFSVTNQCDQLKLHVAINKDFKIWVSCFGWPLPADHNVTKCDLHMETISTFILGVESMSLCSGIELPPGFDPAKHKRVREHIVTTRVQPFTYSERSKSVLAYRSPKCNVLLPARGVCKACTSLSKTHQRKTNGKSACSSYIGVPSVKNTERLQEAKTSNFTDTVSHYAETNDVPQIFQEFWKMQLKAISEKASNHAMKFSSDVIRFFCDIFYEESSAYQRLRDSKLLRMPHPKTLQKYRKERTNNVNDTITQVSQNQTVLEAIGQTALEAIGQNGCDGILRLFQTKDTQVQNDSSLPSSTPTSTLNFEHATSNPGTIPATAIGMEGCENDRRMSLMPLSSFGCDSNSSGTLNRFIEVIVDFAPDAVESFTDQCSVGSVRNMPQNFKFTRYLTNGMCQTNNGARMNAISKEIEVSKNKRKIGNDQGEAADMLVLHGKSPRIAVEAVTEPLKVARC